MKTWSSNLGLPHVKHVLPALWALYVSSSEFCDSSLVSQNKYYIPISGFLHIQTGLDSSKCLPTINQLLKILWCIGTHHFCCTFWVVPQVLLLSRDLSWQSLRNHMWLGKEPKSAPCKATTLTLYYLTKPPILSFQGFIFLLEKWLEMRQIKARYLAWFSKWSLVL